MRVIPAILVFLSVWLLPNCTPENKQEKISQVNTSSSDTARANFKPDTLPEIPSFITNQNFQPESKELSRKRLAILEHFMKNNSGAAGPTYDTLVDINFDGYRDYLLGCYGKSGSGLKHCIRAYLFSRSKNNYVIDDQISKLVNPSFFLPERKITAFYIGMGGGSGSQLEWINGRWRVTKKFEVDNQQDSTVWEISYPLTKKNEKLRKPFQMVPPVEILERNSYLK